MRQNLIKLVGIFILTGIVFNSCSYGDQSGEHSEKVSVAESNTEHSAESGDAKSAEEGEESGTQLALTDTYDKVRNGVRLILSYDKESNSFKGTLENTTEQTLEKVRVEVHLSNSIELGPTTPVILKPGEKSEVLLEAMSNDFTGWVAHAEAGSNEEGHGKEGEEGEHGEKGGEHK